MEQNKINLSLPHPKFLILQLSQTLVHSIGVLSSLVSNLLERVQHLFLKIPSWRKQQYSSQVGLSGSQTNSGLRDKLNKQNLKRVLVVVLGVVVLVLVVRSIRVDENSEVSQKVEIKDATATSKLNREFSFPVRDSNGEEITQIKFVIQEAELRDEIIVKGQKATAVKGRTFLILNVKITNDFDSALEINTRDYVRLSVNGSEEWLAPDIHNDPVEVQAISTKQTRLGFPINDTDKKLRLRVGEIDSQKEEVEVIF